MKTDKFPSKFYKLGEIQPQLFTFLCAYPHCNGSYAIYLNEQSKLPERIHISTISTSYSDYDSCYSEILRRAKYLVEIIENHMPKSLRHE